MTDSIYSRAADALKALGLIEARRDRKIARAQERYQAAFAEANAEVDEARAAILVQLAPEVAEAVTKIGKVDA